MCGGSKKFSEFQIDCLDAHNEYRSRHGSPKLDLNRELCEYAEDHAKFLAQCDKAKPSKSPYGENIFIKASSKKIVPDAFETVAKWYNESKKQKDSSLNYPSKDMKHFSQLVWRETTTMGVGYAINDKKNTIYIVANYFPPGNNYETFTENVKPVRKPGNDCPSIIKIV